MRRLAPHEVAVRRVREAARDRLIEPGFHAVETLRRPFAGEERLVAVVDVAEQQVGRVGVGARDQKRRHVADVHRQARRDQVAHRLLRRDQHLAAQVPALLFRRELIFEVDAGRAGGDHRLGQFEDVERSAETGFHVGDDRREPIVFAGATFDRIDLVGALERVVDPLHDLRHRVVRIERLVGIYLAGGVRVGGDLPAGEIDRFESRFDGLHRLAAGETCRARQPARSRPAARAVFSAPRRASVCSMRTEPRRRMTSCSVYGREISVPDGVLPFAWSSNANVGSSGTAISS